MARRALMPAGLRRAGVLRRVGGEPIERCWCNQLPALPMSDASACWCRRCLAKGHRGTPLTRAAQGRKRKRAWGAASAQGSSRDLGKVEVDRQGAGKLAVAKHTTTITLLSPCIILILPPSGQVIPSSPKRFLPTITPCLPLSLAPTSLPRCRRCLQPTPLIHDQRIRRVRERDLFDRQVWIYNCLFAASLSALWSRQ